MKAMKAQFQDRATHHKELVVSDAGEFFLVRSMISGMPTKESRNRK